MPTQFQPIDLLKRQRTVPSELRSRDWRALSQWTREHSFFMAGVTRAEILQEMRDMAGRVVRGEAGEYELRKEWEAFLDGIGYRPEPGQEGTIKDLRSLRRFNVALRTNVAIYQGWAYRQRGIQPGPLLASPGWELVRVKPAKAPRDWEARWRVLGGLLHEGRIIAPKLSELWHALGHEFDDALGVDYPPFAWGSGMDWLAVGAGEMMRLGAMTREEIIAQARSMKAEAPATNPAEGLRSTPQVRDKDLKEELTRQLGGLARWEGDKLVYTDPNGSKPATQEELLETWATPLPEAIHSAQAPDGLFQREALVVQATDNRLWRDKQGTDAWEDFQRLLARLVNTEKPERLYRGMRMDQDGLRELLEGIGKDGYTVRRNKDGRWLMPADSWTSNERAAASYAELDEPVRSKKWRVMMEVERPDDEAFKDISRLVAAMEPRIRKKKVPPVSREAEWMMRIGHVLRVAKVVRDAASRTVRILLRGQSA